VLRFFASEPGALARRVVVVSNDSLFADGGELPRKGLQVKVIGWQARLCIELW
jgi:hypothetical protein